MYGNSLRRNRKRGDVTVHRRQLSVQLGGWLAENRLHGDHSPQKRQIRLQSFKFFCKVNRVFRYLRKQMMRDNRCKGRLLRQTAVNDCAHDDGFALMVLEILLRFARRIVMEQFQRIHLTWSLQRAGSRKHAFRSLCHVGQELSLTAKLEI